MAAGRSMIVLVALGGLALIAWNRKGAQAAALDSMFSGGAVIDTAAAAIYNTTGIDLMNWQTVAARPENEQYVATLHAAELRYGIPRDMLVRLAYQESRFRQDIISGQVKSSAGAVGIMQIVPRWHPGVDPLNVPQAIDYAAKYLSNLYRQFGTWERALQAYNWGPGNLSKYLAGTGPVMPAETRNYSGQILGDLNATGATIA